MDAGHGGIDGGAIGVDSIVEKDINLQICLVLRDIFRANGFEVIMTRESDQSIHDADVTGTRNIKVSDLHNRLAIVKEHPNAIFLSIHQNKFGESSSKGTQVFFGPKNAQSKQLAEIIQSAFIKHLQPENHRKYKQAGKNLYLMYNAECPSVLVECGFLSNSGEAHRLTDPEYQAQIAFVTFGSVMEYLGLSSPDSVSF